MSARHTKPLTINLICEANGKGLERDRTILHKELTALGCRVHCLEGDEEKNIAHADINIFCERLPTHFLAYAKTNLLIPNPEWCFVSHEDLRKVDLILCRTREVERIFKEMNKPTYYLGFTSPDASLSFIDKDFKHFLHVAGGSCQKGTHVITAAWALSPHFPHLTLLSWMFPPVNNVSNIFWISSHLPLEVLRQFQNQCGIHLCLSETEGYGHYLMEAMSLGAVVVTTNAPPMNEFVKDSRCLVAYEKTSRQQLATNYYACPENLMSQVNRLLHLSDAELRAIGQENRARYLRKTKDFKVNLKTLINSIQEKMR